MNLYDYKRLAEAPRPRTRPHDELTACIQCGVRPREKGKLFCMYTGHEADAADWRDMQEDLRHGG